MTLWHVGTVVFFSKPHVNKKLEYTKNKIKIKKQKELCSFLVFLRLVIQLQGNIIKYQHPKKNTILLRHSSSHLSNSLCSRRSPEILSEFFSRRLWIAEADPFQHRRPPPTINLCFFLFCSFHLSSLTLHSLLLLLGYDTSRSVSPDFSISKGILTILSLIPA